MYDTYQPVKKKMPTDKVYSSKFWGLQNREAPMYIQHGRGQISEFLSHEPSRPHMSVS